MIHQTKPVPTNPSIAKMLGKIHVIKEAIHKELEDGHQSKKVEEHNRLYELIKSEGFDSLMEEVIFLDRALQQACTQIDHMAIPSRLIELNQYRRERR